MKKTMRFTAAAILFPAFLSLAGCVPRHEKTAHVPPGDIQRLRDDLTAYVTGQMKKHGVPGVSIALVDEKGVLWAAGFGYADKDRRIPARPDTVYQAASLSKPVAGAAVMKLVERGRLDLDSPVQSSLPRFAMKHALDTAPLITPRALLAHHAGLPRYYLKGIVSPVYGSLLDQELSEDYVIYPPGERFDYSNVGYALVGDVVAEAAGSTYESFVEEQLFLPLEMARSFFTWDERSDPAPARIYLPEGPLPFMPFRDHASSGLISSVLDLGNFVQCLLAGGVFKGRQVFERNTVEKIFEPQFPDAPLSFGHSYGIGWFLDGIPEFSSYDAAWHNGRTLASWSRILLLRDRKLGVVILANAATARPLVYKVTKRAMTMLLQFRGELPPADVFPVERERGPSRFDKERMAELTGPYSFGGYLVRVYPDGGDLKLAAGGRTLHLIPNGREGLEVKKKILGLFPVSTPLPVLELQRVNGGEFLVTRDTGLRVGEKVQPGTISNAWRKRLGEYAIVNPDTTQVIDFKMVRLAEEEGILLLEVDSDLPEARGKLVLNPVNDEAAVIAGANPFGGPNGAVVGETVNGMERFRFSGYVFEKL